MEADLISAGLRIEIGNRDEKFGLKIREAELKKVPYIVVIGDYEIASGRFSVRKRKDGNLGQMDIMGLIDHLKNRK